MQGSTKQKMSVGDADSAQTVKCVTVYVCGKLRLSQSTTTFRLYKIEYPKVKLVEILPKYIYYIDGKMTITYP